ncbi:MAG: shikimate kinase [Alphaproteobacteria bacterium RIFCSPHIGHO2_12_FULL_63_12]|nr:MAG: shikimate kinase [Alphaproteobacteria bacterium RIFCSPHIGHO2_12_FULL_63_12]
MSSPRRKPPASPRIDRPIALVGMMGAGKTTVGRRLATALNLQFHDADAEIEEAAGMSVADLFARHGEESFRRGEAQVIERLLSGPPVVLATGGGALMNETTRALVKERAISIWIRADVDTLVKRATKRATRPLLKGGDPKEIISRLLEARTPFYAAADIAVDSNIGSHARTVRTIVEALTAYLDGERAL